MTPLSVFYQACPVCGRSLRMPVQYFGRRVTCVHCGGEFRADEQSSSTGPTTQAAGPLSMPGLVPDSMSPLGSQPAADGP
jgi:hypothetical protein